MFRALIPALAAAVLSLGLASCDDDVAEIETPEGEVEIEED
jgi:hypothetical protein